MAFFYRRSLGGRDAAGQHVVYVVVPIPGGKRDSEPVIGGFPAGWRPTENPGQCLAAPGDPPAVLETFVPRSQFRHYERISEAEALTFFPDLLR